MPDEMKLAIKIAKKITADGENCNICPRKPMKDCPKGYCTIDAIMIADILKGKLK